MTRRFLPALVSIIIVCGIGVGAYLLYRSHTSARDAQLMEIAESIEWRQAPLKRCLAMIRQEDNYALFEDNKLRIEKWCDDHRRIFRGDDGPPVSEMTEAENQKMNHCVGRIIVELSPPEPHRTIEDIFDTVRTIQYAKAQCSHDAAKSVKARSE
jgi:hypothetical protein